MPARILVVEDNPANLELMVYLLTAFGHEPWCARDGVEAMEMLARQLPDLVVCDIQLPRMDGYQVLNAIKGAEAWRSVPVVAVTAFAMVGDRDRVLAAGFNGYIGKPINPETFVAQVDAFLPPDQRSRRPAQVSIQSEAECPAESVTRRGTILVVDNLPTNRELARSVLESHGYAVVEAGGMAEALKRLRGDLPDLILSDVGMSEGSGFDFLRSVKADPRLAAIPFVFLTATYDNQRDRAYGHALGADGYLFRPIEPHSLLVEIESRLARSL